MFTIVCFGDLIAVCFGCGNWVFWKGLNAPSSFWVSIMLIMRLQITISSPTLPGPFLFPLRERAMSLKCKVYQRRAGKANLSCFVLHVVLRTPGATLKRIFVLTHVLCNRISWQGLLILMKTNCIVRIDISIYGICHGFTTSLLTTLQLLCHF